MHGTHWLQDTYLRAKKLIELTKDCNARVGDRFRSY